MPVNRQLKLTTNFVLGEFIPPDMDYITPTLLANLIKVAEGLEQVRARCGHKPVRVTSGYRTLEHHLQIYRDIAKRKGVPFDKSKVPMGSYHLTGRAADVDIEGMTAQQVQAECDPWYPGGMEFASTWTHFDIGPRRRFYE